jgi:general secretion pathway protein G
MKTRRFRSRRGFTLLELLVVLVILGLLAGVIGPQVMKHVGTSKSKTATVQIEELGTAVDMYRLEVGSYPTTAQGLAVLVQRPAGVEQWNGPYLRKSVVPKDPWGRDYQYRHPGEHGNFDIYSLGADNADGGEGESADVVNWK